MRRYTGALLGIGLLVGLPFVVALAAELGPRFRLKRMTDELSQPSPGYRPLTDLIDPANPIPDLTEVEELLSDTVSSDFDPAEFDEIDVAGNGKTMAFTGLNLALQREVVLVHERNDPSKERTERVSVNDGNHERPSVRFDRLGRRLVVRAEGGDGTQANIFLHSTRRNSDADGRIQNVTRLPRTRTRSVPVIDDETGMQAEDEDGNLIFETVTDTVTGDVYDPTFAAKNRTVTIVADVKRVGRDARVAFVSTADLDHGGGNVFDPETGRNPAGLPQLFLWREVTDTFRQLTSVATDGAELNRPSMDGAAKLIAFECTDDLTPGAANPADPSQVGNPAGVRQIFIWRKGLGVEQITWSDADCFSPRVDRRGRVVYFCSQGDLIPGGNPEGNYEIFRWKRSGPAALRLRQMTAAEEGDSVLPRPTDRAQDFVFYSTARPALDGEPFGAAPGEDFPKAFMWRRGKTRLVHGSLDSANLQTLFFYGPPAPGRTLSKVHLGTTDPLPQPPPETGIPTTFYLVRATRYRR